MNKEVNKANEVTELSLNELEIVKGGYAIAGNDNVVEEIELAVEEIVRIAGGDQG